MAFKVMSFNVRMDTDKDGDNRWDCRKECVADVIRSQAPLVVGLQEPHKHQVTWLAEALASTHGCCKGKGRSPVVFGKGEEHCEYNPIFYDTTRLQLQSSGTFWLSDVPQVPYTKFSGSAFPRIATWAKFAFADSGRTFTFVCTHFDHEGEEPRTKSAQLIVSKAGELAEGGPLVVVGDLNAGVESQAYQILSSTLRDSSCTEGCCPAPGLLPAGNSTFCGFDDSISSVIDFIFVNDAVQVHSFGVVNAKTPSGACVSDHKPIVAEIELA